MKQMQDEDSPQIIKIPLEQVSASELIQRLTNENFEFRKKIDEMANILAVQKELIQQLRDEIAILKGQKPKPKIPPSRLEGPGSKPD
jgi:DNA gyrase/topoisomerase IV subunit A